MGEQRRTRGWAAPIAIGAVVLLVAAALVITVVFPKGHVTPGPPSTATPTEPPASSATETSPPTEEVYPEPPTPTPEPVLETTEGTDVTEQGVLGEVEVEYPIRMSPGSSDLLILSIYIPPQLASLAPVSVARVEIPPDAPDIVGKHETHRSTILVAETMRVELSSPTFAVNPHYPPLREVDIRHVNVATVWAWDIAAPEIRGLHVLTARVYLGEEETPVWVRGFEVDVIELTPTPRPTQRPMPTQQPAMRRLVTGILDNAAILVVVLLIVLLILVGAAVGVYVVLRRQKREDAREWIGGDGQAYNLAAIRELLQAAFTAETLRRFCLDRPPFRPVVAEFGPGQGLDDMVDRVIDYCETHVLWREFLAEVERENPRQYRRYERKLREKNR
jgi:flagellar basal body-associated protein FliL